jgi:hypothetical protein
MNRLPRLLQQAPEPNQRRKQQADDSKQNDD